MNGFESGIQKQQMEKKKEKGVDLEVVVLLQLGIYIIMILYPLIGFGSFWGVVTAAAVGGFTTIMMAFRLDVEPETIKPWSISYPVAALLYMIAMSGRDLFNACFMTPFAAIPLSGILLAPYVIYAFIREVIKELRSDQTED